MGEKCYQQTLLQKDVCGSGDILSGSASRMKRAPLQDAAGTASTVMAPESSMSMNKVKVRNVYQFYFI